MSNCIYGVEVDLDGLTVEGYPIARETEKSVTTEERCSCLEYRKRHSKKYDPIHRTADEAVAVLKRKLEDRIVGWLSRIEHDQKLLKVIAQQEAHTENE